MIDPWRGGVLRPKLEGIDTYDILSGLSPKRTFVQEMQRALDESLSEDKNVLVCGQQIKYGIAGLTTGLYEKYPEQLIVYPTSESLMNSSAMGLALAGKRVVMIHIRIDFAIIGMDALANHIPVWAKKGYDLPITFIVEIGKGMGQGPQHSKNMTYWFRDFEGWVTKVPETPEQAYSMLKESIFGNKPVMYVIHRELFNLSEGKYVDTPENVRLCGTSQRHEHEFYG